MSRTTTSTRRAIEVENCDGSRLGYGNWRSCVQLARDGGMGAKIPWELVSNEHLASDVPAIKDDLSGKSEKASPATVGAAGMKLSCGSATDLVSVASGSFDLVITDPPFGGLLHYSELADFFYVWLRLVLKERYPDQFTGRVHAEDARGGLEPRASSRRRGRLLPAPSHRELEGGAPHPEAGRHARLHVPPQRGRAVGFGAREPLRRWFLPRGHVPDPQRRDEGRRRVRLAEDRVRHRPRLPEANRGTDAGELGEDARQVLQDVRA
jgi:hypothetical protein